VAEDALRKRQVRATRCFYIVPGMEPPARECIARCLGLAGGIWCCPLPPLTRFLFLAQEYLLSLSTFWKRYSCLRISTRYLDSPHQTKEKESVGASGCYHFTLVITLLEGTGGEAPGSRYYTPWLLSDSFTTAHPPRTVAKRFVIDVGRSQQTTGGSKSSLRARAARRLVLR
jgi:hypothetical protein